MPQGTTYNLPNFTGQLFMRGQRPNAILQLIGGLTGYQTTRSTEFTTGQGYDVPDHKSQPAVVEGNNAPEGTNVARGQGTNVVQIFHETLDVSYTRQAASGQLSGLNTTNADNPVVSELDFQTGVRMEYIARQLNWVCINGVYQKPADNTTGRKTRGLLAATVTNVQALAGAPALTDAHLETAMQQLVDSGGIADGDSVICLAGTGQMRRINALYKTDFNKTNNTRDVGGVRIRTVLTAFGSINFVLEPDMPAGTLAFANVGAMSLVGLEHPEKGVLYREGLAKTGAADRFQIYGELGLNHGPEHLHAKITGLATT